MSTKKQTGLVLFLKELMRRHKLLPSQLALKLQVSHATVSRWLSGKDSPNIGSCRKIAEYSGLPVHRILYITGLAPEIANGESACWPEFREYVLQKYPDILDEDLIIMIEDLIVRRRARRIEAKHL